jgi:hypothetical protein
VWWYCTFTEKLAKKLAFALIKDVIVLYTLSHLKVTNSGEDAIISVNLIYEKLSQLFAAGL